MSDDPPRPGPSPDGLDSLELRQLRHFLAVAEELSFTRGADRLHLAQQALSASIRRLEDQLGVALFTRSTRHVALTPAGEVLLPEARAVLSAAEHALARVGLAAAGRVGRLAVGFSTAAGGLEIVREVIRTFAREAPDVEIQPVEHDFGDPSAGLAAGRVGAAFVFGPEPATGLATLALVEESRLLAVAPDHDLASRRDVTADDLRALPWLRVPAPPGAWRDFWFPQAAGGRPGPVIRTADEWVTAIESGRGCAFTMPSVMRNFTTARVRVVPVAGLPPASVLLAWRTSEPDPLVGAFVETARGVLAAGAGGYIEGV